MFIGICLALRSAFGMAAGSTDEPDIPDDPLEGRGFGSGFGLGFG